MFEPVHHFPVRLRPRNTQSIEPSRPRDAEILEAYERIKMSIIDMLKKHRIRQRWVEFTTPFLLPNSGLINEFVCSFCSLKFYFKNNGYILELTTSPLVYHHGNSLNSIAILRIALNFTQRENTHLMIENALKLSINHNPLAYFENMEYQYTQLSERVSAEWKAKQKQG